MAKQPKQANTDSGRSARQARTGMDRFADPVSAGQAIGAAQNENEPRHRTESSPPRRETTASGRTTKLTPRTKGSSRRPIAPGRTERERSLHLRKIAKRKERRAKLFKVVMFLLSIVCGVLAVTTFFQIEVIDIEGLSRYSKEEVQATLGLKKGDNLFFSDRKGGEKRLREQYPFFESVWVERDLPNRMVVHIKEALPIAAVNGMHGGWFVLDKDCRVLEQTDQNGAREIAQVLGIRTSGGEPGKPLMADNLQAIEDLKTLANALETAGMAGKPTLYNLQDSDNIWFLYEERFAVCVGDTSDLSRKLAILDALIHGDQFTPSDRGSINLALGDRAITNMSLSQADVLKTARGQMEIERIKNPTAQKEEAQDEDE